MRRWRSVAMAAWLGSVGVAGADSPGMPPGTPASRAALAACERAGEAPAAERAAGYDAALAQADAAIAADDGDALAHFAAFCALGKRMRLDGASVRSLVALRRLRAEIDRTLALAPDFADALGGKGALLLDTPRLLGGDPAEAEALLRRAITLDPDWVKPRLDLARALIDRGDTADGRRQAEAALALARQHGRADQEADARALLARAGS